MLLIETQGETAQALALRLNCPVVVVDRIERDVAVIASAASNPHIATQKSSATCNSRESGWCRLPITPPAGLAHGGDDCQRSAGCAAERGRERKDIDTAMRLGVNYPSGPIAWARGWAGNVC